MRLGIVIAGLMLAAGAQATEHTHDASKHTCAELRSMVRSHGSMNIFNGKDVVTVHSSHVVCHQNGMSSKYEVVRASDKGCVVGLACSVYTSGM